MDGCSLRFFDLESIKLTFKSLTEQIIQVGSFSYQNSLDLSALQDLYDNNVVLNKPTNNQLSQNININTTFGNSESDTLGITTYEFLQCSQLFYNKILPPNSTNLYEIANFGTVKNLFSSLLNYNIGFYTLIGNNSGGATIPIIAATSGINYNFERFFSIDDSTHVITCISPCILFYILSTDGNESLASTLKIEWTPNGSPAVDLTSNGIPSILQSCLNIGINDTIKLFNTNSGSSNHSLTLVAFAS